ncbi:MAG: hypothetical protein IJP94_01525 [Clostridia bacterium]|nr:hypothetical protein [Clostridia bacterium]
MTQKEAAAIGLIGMIAAMGAAMIVCSLIWYVLQVIARWKIFTKAGEKGWKAIIPVYNEFVMYKISWKTMFFWIMFALVVAGSLVSSLAGTGQNANGFLLFLAFVLLIAACVIGIIQLHNLSKAFGHGAGFTVGLVLLNPIFMLILAFGSSEYKGIQD